MQRPSSPAWFTLTPTALFALLFLAMSTLTRLALAMNAGTGLVPPVIWPGIFALGLWFDLAVLAWLLAPLLLIVASRRERSGATRWRRALRYAAFLLAAFALLVVALAEWTFWEEFATRFNFIAVDYLIYTHEVIGNIVESYPLGWLLAGVALLAVALVWAMRRPIAVHAPAPSPRARLARAALALALPLTSWSLADIEQMRFSGNAYANELAGNGLMTFAAAFRGNELDYDRLYATIDDERAARILAGLGVERAPLANILDPATDDDEAFDAARLPFRAAPRNVVLITVESLSAGFLGAFGERAGLTPRLDELARDGMLFTRLYATGTRTVRGLEALTLGTPPIPGQAIVRRPGNEHLATLGEILRRQGYETLFVYGGYGYFDNMNAYFAGNDYQVIDRTDFPAESVGFANVWGVADEYLYDNALARIDRAHASGKPFLAQIMTTSNHRPYTYPDGRIDIPSPGGREGAVKYSDHAIGRFIAEARNKPWFAETLFVIVADHCASAAGKTRLPPKGYHIPLILYAPALLRPGRVERLASQLDVPPTLLDILGLPGDDHFFGKSVFEQGTDRARAFISNYQELGYLVEDRLVVLGPKRRVEIFAVDAEGETWPLAADANDELLVAEAVAYYQSAFRAFKRGALKLR